MVDDIFDEDIPEAGIVVEPLHVAVEPLHVAVEPLPLPSRRREERSTGEVR